MKTKAYGAQNAHDKLEPTTIERRALRPHDVHIEILFCGVCHSDIHTVRNEWGGDTVYPVVPGHEIVGKVIEIGDQVKTFAVGDTAGVGVFVDSCRKCDNCGAGLEQYCAEGMTNTYNALDRETKEITYGGYSKDIVVDEKYVLHISHTESLEKVAPLLCAGITTYSPLKYWKIKKGDTVAVVGLGGLGHMGVKLAASLGADVTVLSTSPSKEKDANALGAHRFCLTTDEENRKALAGAFDYILDTVSAPHDYNEYLKMLKTNGSLICVGLPPVPASVSIFNLIRGRKSMSGSMIGGISETQEMLDYCAKNNITSDVEVIRIDQVNEAYERMLKGDVHYRFVIDMSTL